MSGMDIHLYVPPGLHHAWEPVKASVERGISRSTALVTNAAIEKAPRKTGNLKRSIMAEPVESIGGKYLGHVKQDKQVASYGPFVEFGTGIYGPKHAPIKPRHAPYLVWRNSSGWHRAKQVRGMRPRPYMRPALKDNVDNVERIMNDELKHAVKRIGE